MIQSQVSAPLEFIEDLLTPLQTVPMHILLQDRSKRLGFRSSATTGRRLASNPHR